MELTQSVSQKFFQVPLCADCVGEAVFIQYYQTCQYYSVIKGDESGV